MENLQQNATTAKKKPDFNVLNVEEQVAILRGYFPGIGEPDLRLTHRKLPPKAQGLFAVPCSDSIAPTYQAALNRVLCALSDKFEGRFISLCPETEPRQNLRTKMQMEKLRAQQMNRNCLLMPMQIDRYLGDSATGVRETCGASEFGLDSFTLAVILLTHPDLLKQVRLSVSCPGDDHAAIPGRFTLIPFFGMRSLPGKGESLVYNIRSAGDYDSCCSPATGFLFDE